MTRFLLVVLLALACVGAASAAELPSADAPNPSDVTLPDILVAPAVPEQLTWDQLLPIWQGAGAAYGIPWSVLASIDKIESDFGRNMGPSSAGAIGWMQFMPDTWARWGVDANGDGVTDPWNAEDAIYSAARYLAASGGATDISSAVFSYNHAQWYVDEVLQLAAQYDGGGTDFGRTVEVSQAALDAARQAVLDANQRLLDAQAHANDVRVHADELASAAASTSNFTDRLNAQKLATLANVDVAQADADVSARAAELQAAQDALAAAQSGTGFGPAAGGPSYSDGYVFPVAGGAGIVSVGHTHHDYPAADIAAPEGSQVYALSDGTVEDAWPEGNGSCGIGFVIATTDGLEWTYCHLAVLDPAVVAGAALAAGQPAGLVGHTGHASGPHLHLQLKDPTGYPQDEGWFQSFADTAFSWSDSIQSNPAANPVFAVVGAAPAPSDEGSDGVVMFSTSGA